MGAYRLGDVVRTSVWGRQYYSGECRGYLSKGEVTGRDGAYVIVRAIAFENNCYVCTGVSHVMTEAAVELLPANPQPCDACGLLRQQLATLGTSDAQRALGRLRCYHAHVATS